MADTHHKSETRTPTTATSKTRAHYYRVGYRPNRGQPNPLPQLAIKGRWLGSDLLVKRSRCEPGS